MKDNRKIMEQIWEEFKEDGDFYQRVVKELSDGKFDEMLNSQSKYFNNLWMIDFETETANSEGYKQYLKETGRTRSRMNFFYMYNVMDMVSGKFGKSIYGKKWNDRFQYCMLFGTKIDDIFENIASGTIHSSIYHPLRFGFHNLDFDGIWIKDWLLNNNFVPINKNGMEKRKFIKDMDERKVKPSMKENCFCISYNGGKISEIEVYFQRNDGNYIKIEFICTLKLLSVGCSINTIAKSLGWYKKDQQNLNTLENDKFLAKSFLPELIDRFNEDKKYVFYCMRDVIIQSAGVLYYYWINYKWLQTTDRTKKQKDRDFNYFIRRDITISRGSTSITKLCNPENRKYLQIDYWHRLFFDRGSKGGLTNFCLENQFLVFTRDFIDKMEFKTVGGDDIKSAYPHKLQLVPTGEIYLNQPEDYSPDKYKIYYEIGYENIRPRNPKATIGMLKDFLPYNIAMYEQYYRDIKTNDITNEMYNLTIDTGKDTHILNGYKPFKNMIDFYGLHYDNEEQSWTKLLENYNLENNNEKLGRLLVSAKKYYLYGDEDLVREIERFYIFDKKTVFDKYWLPLTNSLKSTQDLKFDTKENGMDGIKNQMTTTMTKISINSFYGKTSQKFIFPDLVVDNEEIEHVDINGKKCIIFLEDKYKRPFLILNSISTVSTKYMKDSIKLLNVVPYNPRTMKNYNNKAIANHCCNQTQSQIMKAINDNNPENHIYSDTDSRFWYNNDISKMNWGNKLGDWDTEFLIEFVKHHSTPGYLVKVYKRGKVAKQLQTLDKSRIVFENDDYIILDKYFMYVSLVVRQKTYFFYIIDFKNLDDYHGFTADELVETFQGYNPTKMNKETFLDIISQLIAGYEDNNGEWVGKHLCIKYGLSGIRKLPTPKELFSLLLTNKTNFLGKDMVRTICNDGGMVLEWKDKIVSVRKVKVSEEEFEYLEYEPGNSSIVKLDKHSNDGNVDLSYWEKLYNENEYSLRLNESFNSIKTLDKCIIDLIKGMENIFIKDNN